MILLDTDTFTLQRYGHQKVVARILSSVDQVAITLITRIEVLRGRFASVLTAANSKELMLAQERVLEIETALNGTRTVFFTAASAARFEQFKQDKSLRKVGVADLAIGCIALEHGGRLVTRNTKDFRLIPGLKLENWAD